jgi:glycogen synthase kinase 3 beta
MHLKGVVHRDIKPQNLLVDPTCHVLKVCDFGSAKKLQADETSTCYICTRYYRAPELIFGKKDYDSKIDLWSAGCVFAELLLGKPLFTGYDQISLLAEIMKCIGSPEKELVKRLVPTYSKKIPNIPPQPWKKVS